MPIPRWWVYPSGPLRPSQEFAPVFFAWSAEQIKRDKSILTLGIALPTELNPTFPDTTSWRLFDGSLEKRLP
jgi:hypothetical protein